MPAQPDEKRILEIFAYQKKTGESWAKVAKHFGCSQNSITAWRRQYTLEQLSEKYKGKVQDQGEIIYVPEVVITPEQEKLMMTTQQGLTKVSEKLVRTLSVWCDQIDQKVRDRTVKPHEIKQMVDALRVIAPYVVAPKGDNKGLPENVSAYESFVKQLQQSNKQVQSLKPN